jgi:hypothetical protein
MTKEYTTATEKKAKAHHCTDGWTKIGNTFLALDNIARIVVDSEDPLCVCVTDKSGTAGPHLTLEGDEAEALLCEIGYSEDVRKAEREKAEKAAEKAAKAAEKEAEKDAEKEPNKAGE